MNDRIGEYIGMENTFQRFQMIIDDGGGWQSLELDGISFKKKTIHRSDLLVVSVDR